jgi:Lipocalin-like domain
MTSVANEVERSLARTICGSTPDFLHAEFEPLTFPIITAWRTFALLSRIWESKMKIILAVVVIVAGIAVNPSASSEQESGSVIKAELNHLVSYDAKDLVGSWALVSVVTEQDGTKSDTYGPTAKGFLVFDANGRYSIIFVAGNLPKFEVESRSKGTANENKAVLAGSLAHFGTYVVDETDKSFTFQVVRATFPNWEGRSLKRSFVITGDVLRFTDPHASAGGVATTTFERAK